MSLRGAGLLGRGRRLTPHLPRPHLKHQDPVPLRGGGHQPLRLRHLGLPRDPQHREPLLRAAAGPHGTHLPGEVTLRFEF